MYYPMFESRVYDPYYTGPNNMVTSLCMSDLEVTMAV